ncbi:unnamed protein product [Paramecium pentaurelia]|uniref:Uncharacterized protein n=1 Tax=Paramecium pentaurelia TaxID=43138 RepID=A0A8S1YGR5_9CILI|nr:unnamed protein product [Paramecium pentaurelia]
MPSPLNKLASTLRGGGCGCGSTKRFPSQIQSQSLIFKTQKISLQDLILLSKLYTLKQLLLLINQKLKKQ